MHRLRLPRHSRRPEIPEGKGRRCRSFVRRVGGGGEKRGRLPIGASRPAGEIGSLFGFGRTHLRYHHLESALRESGVDAEAPGGISQGTANGARERRRRARAHAQDPRRGSQASHSRRAAGGRDRPQPQGARESVSKTAVRVAAYERREGIRVRAEARRPTPSLTVSKGTGRETVSPPSPRPSPKGE